MRLWTWQGPGFSLTAGRVDWTKSPYRDTVPGIHAAYPKIIKRLKLEPDDRIFWCEFSSNPESPYSDRVKWSLDVPDEAILAIIDQFIWNRILGIEGCYPLTLRDEWAEEASQSSDDYID